MSQKRKNESIPALVMLADSGRWLGKFRKEGAKAMIIWWTHSEPEDGDGDAKSRGVSFVGLEIVSERVLTSVALNSGPEHGENDSRNNGELRREGENESVRNGRTTSLVARTDASPSPLRDGTRN